VKEDIEKAIREALESGRASAVVFLADDEEGVMPRVATSTSDDTTSSAHGGDERYPVAAFASILQPGIDGTVAVVCRECDRRMMVELSKHNKLELDRVLVIGIPCSDALATECGCDHPTPPEAVCAALAEPKEYPRDSAAFSDDAEERLAFWMGEFERCMRCQGCRNVCPLCYCNDCALDNPDLMGPDTQPPDIPLFHLVRAVDMSDRCVDCGMCEVICPAAVPLRSLYRQAREVVRDAFGYEPGLDPDEKSPLEMLGEPEGLAGMQEGFRTS